MFHEADRDRVAFHRSPGFNSRQAPRRRRLSANIASPATISANVDDSGTALTATPVTDNADV